MIDPYPLIQSQDALPMQKVDTKKGRKKKKQVSERDLPTYTTGAQSCDQGEMSGRRRAGGHVMQTSPPTPDRQNRDGQALEHAWQDEHSTHCHIHYTRLRVLKGRDTFILTGGPVGGTYFLYTMDVYQYI